MFPPINNRPLSGFSTDVLTNKVMNRRPNTVDNKVDRHNPMARFAKEFDVPQWGRAKYMKGYAYKMG